MLSKEERKQLTVCPCCGCVSTTLNVQVCSDCGARRVGEPLAQPDIKLPSLGPAITALAVPLLVLTAFGCLWLFGNDMKVLRALATTFIGESTKVTTEWLRLDPRLPYYRIFSFDAYRLAFYLSAGILPLALGGLWLARRALRLAKAESSIFGGLRMARASFALSGLILVIVSTVTVTAIPGAIERGREKRVAATHAVMYQLHEQALKKYYDEFGTYPQELQDLSRVNREPVGQQDYWERSLTYTPVSVIASKGPAVGFSNYRLVSAGPDGELGTDDDITMIDGVIVSNKTDLDVPTGWSTSPSKARE